MNFRHAARLVTASMVAAACGESGQRAKPLNDGGGSAEGGAGGWLTDGSTTNGGQDGGVARDTSGDTGTSDSPITEGASISIGGVTCGDGGPGRTPPQPDFLDRIDFGNSASEAAHTFDPDAGPLPPSGVGALFQTFRAPLGVAGTNHPYGGGAGVQLPIQQDEQLTFTLKCDPALQNYVTIKMWGSDAQQADVQLLRAPTNYDAFVNHSSGGPPPSPGRFFYATVPIPIAWTQGHAIVVLTLFESNANPVGQPAVPIYSAFSGTDPYFVLDAGDPQGMPPTPTGELAPTALTQGQVVSMLRANRESIYGSGGYYGKALARQVMPGTAGAPAETIGLDLWTDVSSWGGAAKTPDVWRDQIGGGQHGPGYATFPDEVLSILYTTYLLPPFTDGTGSAVAGLDHNHDPSLLQRTVYALDGSTYLQGSDGRFNRDAGTDSSGVSASGVWQGLTSGPRAAGHAYAGSTARGLGWTLSLEGVDTQTLGLAIIALLRDPNMPPSGGTANPRNFVDYLGGSFDANLDGGSMLRATAYERMLSQHVSYLQIAKGGTISQNLFQELGMYASHVALEMLQTRFPSAAYSGSASTALTFMEQAIGLAATTLSNPNGTAFPNFSLSAAGFGEAHGVLSGGYDGRYGQILPWLMPLFAELAQVDPALASNPLLVTQATQNARHAIDGYAQFISSQEDYDPSTGADQFTLAQEDYITYRNPYGANADARGFNVDAQYAASDPLGGIRDAYALRSAYLEALYGKSPATAPNGTASLNYLRSLPAYESTLRALIDVSPSSLTPLPGEPGQPDFAFADAQEGVAAFIHQGERFYLNANWRNYEFHNNGLGVVSNYARIHDTVRAADRLALIEMPHDPATLQSDGNLSGEFGQPWFVRYGDYLVAFNGSVGSASVRLPSESRTAVDLLSKTCLGAGATLTLAPGHSAILWLGAQ